LLSAVARSLVYLATMMRAGAHGRLAVVLVEMGYVTLTAGIYAGMQQKALRVRPRLVGSAIVVVGVPGLAQLFDLLAHHATGAVAPPRATLSVCVFALISALFHLHVMRHGAFLTGSVGRSLAEDFRAMPRLVAGFAARPFVMVRSLQSRPAPAGDAGAA
jgi:hypothetical protein